MSAVTIEKRIDRTQLGLALLAGLSLFSLYLYFANNILESVVSSPMDGLESAVFYTMVIRVLGFMFVPFLRRLHPQVKILIFSFEAFILFLLILFSLFTGVSAYEPLMSEILTSWLGATLIFVTPYSIYELSVMMSSGTSFTSLAFSSAPLVAICLFLANFSSRISSLPNGLADFGAAMISTLRTQPGLAGNTNGSGIISGASVIFFLSMIAYIAYRLIQTSKAFVNFPRYLNAIALVIIGSMILFVWLLLSTSLLKTNAFEILSIPGAILLALLWVFSRG